MNRTAKTALYGYGAFCLVNAGIAYFWGRNQPPGTNTLADLNNSLLRLNVLAYILPQGTGPATPAAAVGAPGASAFPALAPAVVTTQPTGTTTYFGP